MVITKIRSIAICTIISLCSFLAGKYFFNTEPEVQIKEVIKYVKIKEEKKEQSEIIRVREEKRPDGTIVTETTTETRNNIETRNTTNLDENKNKIVSKSKTISFGLLAIKDFNNFNQKTDLGVLTVVPLFGNISIAGTIDSSKKVGIGLVLEF